MLLTPKEPADSTQPSENIFSRQYVIGSQLHGGLAEKVADAQPRGTLKPPMQQQHSRTVHEPTHSPDPTRSPVSFREKAPAEFLIFQLLAITEGCSFLQYSFNRIPCGYC
jgi:hypothetical protein